MSLSPQKLAELKAFVAYIKSNPQELHNPALSFFKEYLEVGGYHIPPKPEASKPKEEKHAHAHHHDGHEHGHHEPKKEEPKPAAAQHAEEPEEEDTGLIPADNEAPQSMGSGKEPSDADLEKASSEKAAAMEAQGNGNFDQAIVHFTAAINANSTLAMLFALRANAYLSAKKPNAAVRDSDHAIKLNPDSAKGFKVRGKANRALGKYEDALKDLATGQRIDFDEGSAELIKFLEQKVSKRRERNRKKQAEAKSKKPEAGIYDDMPEMEDLPGDGHAGAGAGAGGAGSFPGMGGMPGMGAMPPGMDKIFSDPEVQAMLADPEVMQKLSGMMAGGMPNPAALAADPKLRKLFEKFGKGGM